MTYTITLTEQQLQVVAAGLGELPLKISGSVMNEIQKQITAANEAHKDAQQQDNHAG